MSERNRVRADEAQRVRDWRVDGLTRIGFTRAAAKRLADESDVVHRAEQLIADGCDHVTAYKLLLPITTPTHAEEKSAPVAESHHAPEHPLSAPLPTPAPESENL